MEQDPDNCKDIGRVVSLLSNAGLLVYALTFQGARYGTQWTSFEGATTEGHYSVRCFSEQDTAVFGLPGIVRRRIRLVVDAQGRPSSYCTEGSGGGFTIGAFGPSTTVHMQDGSVRIIDLDAVDAVLDGGMPGLTAFLVALAHCAGRLS